MYPLLMRSLPSSYVERPQPLQAVKDILLTELPVIPNTKVVSAIYGWGGIGKTVLASAVAQDPEVKVRFPDGVLWADLGQQPDLLSGLSNWIQALGDYNYKPTTPEAASMHLRTLLYDKHALLVVDDAWNCEHVELFCVGGALCRVLVTTREVRIPGAIHYDLDVMTPEQSLALFTKIRGFELSGVEKEQAESLAKEVGYLPLALKLAANRIAEGVSWEELWSDLKAEVARLEALDLPTSEVVSSEEQRKSYSLRASFNLSLRQLSDQQLRLFAWLGVLPEDVTITQAIAATLWKVTSPDAGEILRIFRSKALLSLSGKQSNQLPTYRMHDLMYDIAKRLLIADTQAEDLPGLGLSLPSAHVLLLERYKAKTQNGFWHTLPDDGYIHAHLTWHFQQANQHSKMHTLLQEETSAGRNGWYEACDRLGQTACFVTDVARAWQLAEATYTENPSQSIELQCRYALIITSLNSQAKNIPAELMAALVKNQLWTPAQGLAYAQQIQNLTYRSRALQTLVPHLPTALLPQALEVARNIQDKSARVYALSTLATYLPEVLSEILEAACDIEVISHRIYLLSQLAPYLPSALLPLALEVARSTQGDDNRAYALISLAAHFQEVLPEALEAARSLQNYSRAYALLYLADHFQEVLPEALEAARGLQNYSRAYALTKLATHHSKVLPEALEAARSVQDAHDRADILVGLATYLLKVLPEALEAARSIQDAPKRIDALIKLAAYLPQVLPETLDAVRAIESVPCRADALIELAAHYSFVLPEALEAARIIQDDILRARALSKLTPLLPEVLLEALEAAGGIQNKDFRARALSKLASHLPLALLPKTLEAASSIQDVYAYTSALSRLAANFPFVLPEALAAARGIQNGDSRAWALSELAVHFPEVLPEALEATRAIKNDRPRAHVLSGLAAHFPFVLPEALEAAFGISDGYACASTLSRLAFHLPPALIPKALEVARSIQDDNSRASALRGLASHLPPVLIPEALEVACGIQDDNSRQLALNGLVAHLSSALLPKALEAAYSIRDNYARASALSGLASQFPEVLPKALEAVRSIQEQDILPHFLSKVGILSRLASYFPEVLPEALEATRSIHYQDDHRARALSELASQFPEVLPEALEAARGIHYQDKRARALSDLASRFPEVLPEALEAVCGIEWEYKRALDLRGLTPYLPAKLLPKVLEVARSIQDDNARAHAFICLLPELDLASIQFPFWSEILHNLSHSARPELLGNISNLSTAIIALGGTQALAGTVRAIQEVCRQWH